MKKDKACAKTMPKQSNGIAKRRIRGMPMPNIIWVGCITTDKVCTKICILARNGSVQHVIVEFKKPATNTAI